MWGKVVEGVTGTATVLTVAGVGTHRGTGRSEVVIAKRVTRGNPL